MSRTVISEECLWTYLVYPNKQALKRKRDNILPSELVPASQERQGGTSSPWLKPGASVPLGLVIFWSNFGQTLVKLWSKMVPKT